MTTETAAQQPAFLLENQRLVELGFTKEKQNMKLLKKAGGNVTIVADFLVAKRSLKEACRAHRPEKENKVQKKEEKAQKKVQKKSLKLSKKLAKKDFKISKKDRKHEKKNSSLVFAKQIDLSKQPLPGSIKHIVLDGNNMLFVAAAVRNLVLSHKRAASESVLTAFAKKFHEITHLKLTILFDECAETMEEAGFAVFRARPIFPTADDALVNFAMMIEDRESLLFVSSDVGLLKRLEETGVHLAKPKVWMNFAADLISNANPTEFGPKEDLDSFFNLFVKKMENATLGGQSEDISKQLKEKLSI